MRAMVLEAPGRPLEPVERPRPVPGPGEILIEIEACGVCRTDLHIVDGELPNPALPLVPGHEVVGRVAAHGPGVKAPAIGARVGVPWLSHACGTCRYCREGRENLCDAPGFTGYTRDGGYAEACLAEAAFVHPLPETGQAVALAPLLCAGLIGHRAYAMAGAATRLGLYGFGAAAHLLAQVAIFEGKEIHAFTRPGDVQAQDFARRLGAVWAGGSDETAPVELDAALIFAPVGALVPAALRAVRKGGRVICAGIHMSDIPSFPYADLWQEREIRSVANLTRADGRAFFALAERAGVHAEAVPYPLDRANSALDDLRAGRVSGAAVLVPCALPRPGSPAKRSAARGQGASMMADDLKRAILHHLTYTLGKDPGHAVLSDWRQALTRAVRDRMVDPWFAATRRSYGEDRKRVYYLSMEFLIGRLLEDGLINLGLRDAAGTALEALGQDLAAVLADEPDAALGNGGLGRLAAGFMDSLASLGVPAHGYGIRYENGIFRQRIVDGRQVEEPESWLVEPNHWEFVRAESEYAVGFGGRVEGGRWRPGEEVIARAHDIPVIGWGGRWANTLRLWESRAGRGFDLARFNRGELVAAAAPEALARAISRVLYPDDSTEEGRALRLRQEYFFTAAALADILRRFESTHERLDALPEKVAIQLNDTHPALAGPELVRLLHDERGVAMDDAIALARSCLAYTNHTLLPEALERWPEGLLGALLPRHLELIGRIDEVERAACSGGRRIRVDGTVDMGALSFVMAHRVNGVSALHTGLMTGTVFADLHARYPERIVNETNGITPRRWLKGCNPRLAALVTEAAGPGWEAELARIEALEPLADDAAFRARFMAAKRANKEALSGWIEETQGMTVDPAALFDVQIKRIHEYKRQHLKLLEVVALWQALRDGAAPEGPPRLVLMAGKAAPSYHAAKEIIHLANNIAAVINADPATSDRLKLLFLPDYKVTLAERLIPAADLSEQISMAGKEASGTGNMKFALNGAVTIGTLDGANVEIREHVGPENFILFGLTAEDAAARAATPGHARAAIEADARLARALDAIEQGTFSPDEPGRYRCLVARLRNDDPFLVCSDFDAYWQASRAADAAFADADRWARMAALNTARSGWVSSDRTIRGYLTDIWGAVPAF